MNKRLGTRRDYRIYLAKRFSLTLGGGTLLFGGIVLSVVALISIVLFLTYWVIAGYSTAEFLGKLGLFLGAGASILFVLGSRIMQKSKHIEKVEPITHQNAHLIPPEETLVRASQEPVHEPQEILLRPAASSQSTEPSQLLRPKL